MATTLREAPYRVSAEQIRGSRFGALKIEFVPTGSLKAAKRNARVHSKKQIEQIVSSIRRFGWTCPLLVDEQGVIIAGHGRLTAAIRLGLKTVPVIQISGLSDVEKRALALADNQIALNAGWDRATLAIELSELIERLPSFDLDIAITGFETAEIDSVLGDFKDPETDPADDVPQTQQTAVSKAGDLWQLGLHQLLCGDATKAADMRKLMGLE